jgi:aminoglycoside phosphotransferase (APT) family kinase protein
VELLAEGRMAEVFAYAQGLVVKLDRPEWQGIAAMEADVIGRMDAAGLPVARCHGVVTVGDRSGIVLDRVDGGSLLEVLLDAPADEAVALAQRFVELQAELGAAAVDGLPVLVDRLAGELALSGLPDDLQAELRGLLHELDDGRRAVCHFDLHPGNVLVGPLGWVVIDWLGVAAGPMAADVVRTLLIWDRMTGRLAAFMEAVRRLGLARHGIDDASCGAWARVLAGARLAEGFDETESAWLSAVAAGTIRLAQ